MDNETARLYGRREKLERVMDEMFQKPFSWDNNDCFLGLTCEVVKAIQGRDIGKPWRGKYHTALGALKLLKTEGYDNLADYVATELGEYDHPNQLQTGDIAAIPQEEGGFGYVLGVVCGSTIATHTPFGIQHVPLTAATRGFEV